MVGSGHFLGLTRHPFTQSELEGIRGSDGRTFEMKNRTEKRRGEE